ncbi:MAG: hypothetical protein OSA84_10815 [Akkermansiaceae bacterium]|nr:hypothetical protein [Akkermansiaceae bacterium]
MSSANILPIRCQGLPGLRNTAVCGEELGQELGALVRRPPRGMHLYKFGSRSVVGAHVGETGEETILKYYYPSSQIRSLVYGLRGSRCMRSWHAGLAFGQLGIPTPAPLVVAEAHKLGGVMLESSFLATRPAEGDALGDLVSSHGADHPLVTAAAESLRESFRLMHEHRCAHGDLKANNLILAPDGVVSFIDLDAAAWNLAPSAFAKQRNKDRTRFFKNWDDNPAAAEVFRKCFEER